MKPETRPKLTRGEKCILAHLVLTIGIVIVLLKIYLIHILVVDHSEPRSVFDTRRVLLPTDYVLHKFPVGLLYYINVTPTRNICNTLLLTQEWSVSAGHCVAMRADPDLSHLLHDWRIKYPYDIEGIKIIRSVIHPHFNRDTFANNVGLVQHNPLPRIQRYNMPKIYVDNYYNGDIERKKMTIISWDHGSKEQKDKIEVYSVQPMAMENCTSYVTSIIELRTYEFCIVLKKKFNMTLGHGAVIVDAKDFTVFGMFTWGERQQKTLPLIVLILSHFKEWMESVTLFTPLHV